jgi:hypothetical protein
MSYIPDGEAVAKEAELCAAVVTALRENNPCFAEAAFAQRLGARLAVWATYLPHSGSLYSLAVITCP